MITVSRILPIDGHRERRERDPWRCSRRRGGGGGERHFANWNGTGRRVFFSPFNRNTQRVYPRVPGAPGKKRNWRVQTARKYCSVSARENLLPSLLSRAEGRANRSGRDGKRERKRERGYRRYSCIWERERNRSGEMRKVEEGEIVNERSRRKNNGGVKRMKREWPKYREREMYRKIWLEES